MGRKLDALLGRTSRQTSKLKALLGITVSRLAVLRNQREVRCAHARGDVAQLLRLSQLDRALLRAEQVIKEQNMLDAFVIIEGYCHLLTERASLLEHIKECPEELREAISGLVFAASRCGDMPELQKVRYMLSSRFGREFTSAAVELRNNCAVNPKLIQKLSTRQPSLESKVRVTKEIAAENGIALDLEDPPSEFAAEVDPKQSKPKKQSHPNPAADHSEFDGEDGFPANPRKEYTDVASAAHDAFKSAAFAAAAARAAVELSRSESKGADDHRSRPGSGRMTQHRIPYYSSESEEETAEEHISTVPIPSNNSKEKPSAQLEKCSSASSPDSVQTLLYEREPFPAVVFDKSENETEEQRDGGGFINGRLMKHEASYLHPPYRKGNPVGHGNDFPGSLHEEGKDGIGLGSRINGGRDSTQKLRKPVSMRTRRGL